MEKLLDFPQSPTSSVPSGRAVAGRPAEPRSRQCRGRAAKGPGGVRQVPGHALSMQLVLPLGALRGALCSLGFAINTRLLRVTLNTDTQQ